ncbi:glycosyltransferase family 2 protein, partial [bacterium]|nr:glycosyltransferase family 2 protein [bacterium]
MVSLVEHYTIAICTQGQNSNLNNVITILNEINKSTKYKFEVLIVLNSSISTIETFRNVRIVIEPNLGYSSVRNTALKSVKSSSNLIFIDDDEIPSLTWFENLVSMHEKFQDDIIVGPIYPYREDLLNK